MQHHHAIAATARRARGQGGVAQSAAATCIVGIDVDVALRADHELRLKLGRCVGTRIREPLIVLDIIHCHQRKLNRGSQAGITGKVCSRKIVVQHSDLFINPRAADVAGAIRFVDHMKIQRDHHRSTGHRVILRVDVGLAVRAILRALRADVAGLAAQKQVVLVGRAAVRPLSEYLGLMKRPRRREGPAACRNGLIINVVRAGEARAGSGAQRPSTRTLVNTGHGVGICRGTRARSKGDFEGPVSGHDAGNRRNTRRRHHRSDQRRIGVGRITPDAHEVAALGGCIDGAQLILPGRLPGAAQEPGQRRGICRVDIEIRVAAGHSQCHRQLGCTGWHVDIKDAVTPLIA